MTEWRLPIVHARVLDIIRLRAERRSLSPEGSREKKQLIYLCPEVIQVNLFRTYVSMGE